MEMSSEKGMFMDYVGINVNEGLSEEVIEVIIYLLGSVKNLSSFKYVIDMTLISKRWWT